MSKLWDEFGAPEARDLDMSDVEGDAARMEWEQAQYESWAAEHADQIEEDAYLEWAAMRAADGDDNSRVAYDDHIDRLIAQAEDRADNWG